jgi:hypothetical protein
MTGAAEIEHDAAHWSERAAVPVEGEPAWCPAHNQANRGRSSLPPAAGGVLALPRGFCPEHGCEGVTSLSARDRKPSTPATVSTFWGIFASLDGVKRM